MKLLNITLIALTIIIASCSVVEPTMMPTGTPTSTPRQIKEYCETQPQSTICEKTHDTL